jgi:hypothetical protein
MVFGSRPFDNGKRPTPELKSSPIDFSGCQPAPDARQPGLSFARHASRAVISGSAQRTWRLTCSEPITFESRQQNRRLIVLFQVTGERQPT